MSKALARMPFCCAIFVLLTAGLVGSSWAQYLTPGTLQVSLVQYDGNTNSGSDYVSPYSFPEIFNDQSGCSTGNSICDIAGIEGSIYIDQFNAEPGTTVQNTLSLPSTGTPVTTPGPLTGSYITTSFSSKSEGSLNLSSDGTSLTYMGYLANDQLSDVSNNYSLSPDYQLFPNTYTQDPSIGTPVTITGATYTSSSGKTTITLSSPVTIGPGAFFTIAGMTQAGYNGFYATTNTTAETTSTLAFTLAKSLTLTSCTSSATCGGTALYDPPYGFYDREVALINSTGLVSLSPYDTADSGDNPRGALTVDEQEFYTFGNSDSTLSGETLTPGVGVVPPTSQNNPGLTIGVRCGIPEQNFSYLLGTYFASDRSDETAKKHVKDNNWRGAAIALDANGNEQLYVSKGSGGNGDDGVFLVQDPNTGVLPACSAAEPDNNTAVITPIFSAQATVPGGASYQTSPYLPFGFWFANPTTLYVADEGNPPTYVGGTNEFIDADAGTFTLPQLANGNNAADPYAGLEKWVYSGGSWTLAYTIQAGLNMYQPQSVSGYLDTTSQPINSYTYGLRNMAGVNNNDGTVTIYAITSQFSSVSGGESDPDSLVGITDSLAATTLPANEQFVTLQTSAPGELYRGVAYIPTGNARATQTISFPNPGPVIYGTGPLTLAATATSGWPIAYTLVSGPATLAGNVLTITGAGSVVVQADQSGNTDYSAAPSVQDTITVSQASQTITFTMNAPASAVYNGQFTVAATGGGSGNAVTFTGSGSCSVSGATYTMTSGTGACSVIANQMGNSNYSAAPQVTETVNATLASQTITAAPPAEAYKDDSFMVSATGGGSGKTLVFTSSGSCSNVGSTYLMGKSGSCTGTINQPGNSNFSAAPPYTWTTTIITALVAPAVSLSGAPTSESYGGSFVVTATYPTTEGVPYGVPTITASGSCTAGAVTGSGANYQAAITMTAGTGTCTMKAKWTANFYYAAASAEEQTTAERITPTVTFTGAPSSGTATDGAQFTVTASSNESGTYAGVPTITASGSCEVVSISGGPGNSQATIEMTKATGTCTTKAKWAVSTEYAAETLTQTTTAN
jgi:hypothetical protein